MKSTGRKAAFPPLDLLTSAPVLPADEKIAPRLNVLSLPDDDKGWVDPIFFSAM